MIKIDNKIYFSLEDIETMCKHYDDDYGEFPESYFEGEAVFEYIEENYMKIRLDNSEKESMNQNNNMTFLEELQFIINKHSKENDSNTPDFILSEYLLKCLSIFNFAINKRDKHYRESK